MPSIEQSSRQRAAGPRHPRQQSERLRQPHHKAITARHAWKLLAPYTDPFRQGQQQCHHDRNDGNGGNAAKGRLLVPLRPEEFDSQTNRQDRQSADGHGESQARLGFPPLAMTDGATDPAQHLAEVAAEIGHHGNDAAQLNRGSDGNTGVAPTQEHRHHLEMCRTADRQKFSQTLHHPQHQITPAGLQQGEGCSGVRHRHNRCRFDGIRSSSGGHVGRVT